jgi:hypothetical protein
MQQVRSWPAGEKPPHCVGSVQGVCKHQSNGAACQVLQILTIHLSLMIPVLHLLAQTSSKEKDKGYSSQQLSSPSSRCCHDILSGVRGVHSANSHVVQPPTGESADLAASRSAGSSRLPHNQFPATVQESATPHQIHEHPSLERCSVVVGRPWCGPYLAACPVVASSPMPGTTLSANHNACVHASPNLHVQAKDEDDEIATSEVQNSSPIVISLAEAIPVTEARKDVLHCSTTSRRPLAVPEVAAMTTFNHPLTTPTDMAATTSRMASTVPELAAMTTLNSSSTTPTNMASTTVKMSMTNYMHDLCVAPGLQAMGACGDAGTRSKNHYAPVADAATLTKLVGCLVEEHKDFILHQRIRMAKDELNKAARNLGDVILEERIPIDLLTKAQTYLGAAAAQMNAQSECCDSYIIWTRFLNAICTEIVNKCVHEPVHDTESQDEDFPDPESSEQVDFEVESDDQFDEFLGRGMNTYTPMPTHVVEQCKAKQAAKAFLTRQDMAQATATAHSPMHAANHLVNYELHSVTDESFVKHVHNSERGFGASCSLNLAVNGAKPPGRDCPVQDTSARRFACKDSQ